MADNNVEASASAIIELTRDINNCIKKINNLGETLSSQLKTLGVSFQDEGYGAIQNYISKTQNKVDDKQDSGKQSQPNTAPTKKSDEDKSGKSVSDKKPDSNANKPAEADKKAPAGTERKGNY